MGVDPNITREDIHVRRGDTFRWRLELTTELGAPVDFTGHTFLSQIRTRDGALVCAIAVDEIDLENGVIELVIDDDTTALIDTETITMALWDIQWTTPGGDVRTFMAGNVFLESDTAHE